MSLLEKFEALERAMLFHHSTSTRSIPFSVVAERAENAFRLNTTDLNAILNVWPEAYKVSWKNNQLELEVPGILCKADQRRGLFAEKLELNGANKENIAPLSVAKLSPPPRSNTSNMLRWKPTQKQAQALSMNRDEIRRRVLNKSKKNIDLAAESVQRKQQFYKAQIPAVMRVLRALRTNNTLSMEQVVEKVVASLQTQLSASEARQIVMLAVAALPLVCQVVTEGMLTVVRFKREVACM